MKLNKKGMAVSAMIYSMLLLFLVLMFGILGLLGTRKVTLDKLKHEVLSSLNSNEGTPISISSYIQEGKILHYDGYVEPVEENNTLIWKDLSGNNNHATLLNFDKSKAWNGKGIVLDGIDDIMSYMGTLTDMYTIEIVAQIDLDTRRNILFGGNQYPTLYLEPTTDYKFSLSDTKIFNQTLSTYQLHTITITSDKNNTYLYVDGTKIETPLASEGSGVEQAYIGGMETNSLKGTIYSYMIYNRPLSENEIKSNNYVHHVRFPYEKNKNEIDLYIQDHLVLQYDGYTKPENQTWKNVSGEEYHATLSGIDETSGWKENGIELDGMDDYITTMLTLNPTEGTISTLVSNYQNSGYILRSDVNSRTYIDMTAVTKGDAPYSTIEYPNPLNEEIHQIVLEWKTQNNKLYASLYLDGMLVEEDKEFASKTPGTYITIGSFSLTGEQFAKMKIYNMKYYDKALTTSEVKLNYAIDKSRYID